MARYWLLYSYKIQREMKKIGLFIIAFVMAVAVRAQQVGSAGRLLQNEYQPNKQSRAVIGRGGVTINIDYRWEADYNRGYSEVFIRIPEQGRFTVSIGDQEITNSNGMFRFFDLASVSQPLSIWAGRQLIHRVTISPRDNTRMVMDFFTQGGLYLLDEITLNNNEPSYHGRQWNDVWNRSYSGGDFAMQIGRPMPPEEYQKFITMYKKQTFDDEKLSFFNMQKNLVVLTTAQVGELISSLSFGNSKLSLAKSAYDRVIDPQNYYLLLDKFTFQDEKESFKSFLQSVQR